MFRTRHAIKERMDRGVTRIIRMSREANDHFVPGTPGSRLSLVWPLTEEVTALSKNHHAERRLQRHIAVLRIRIPSVADMICNKRASGRTKDLADAEALESLRSSTSDDLRR